LGPNDSRYARCHFRAQKSLDFQGPTFTMALVMDIARFKSITSRAIKTTGTLIVSSTFFTDRYRYPTSHILGMLKSVSFPKQIDKWKQNRQFRAYDTLNKSVMDHTVPSTVPYGTTMRGVVQYQYRYRT
jgi:hypothetical protein